MNKRVLKSYLKGSRKELLETSCFKFDNSYLISDSYSIIKLNDTYDLKVNEDKYLLGNMYNNFENDYEFKSKYIPIWAEEEHIDDKYDINMKLFKKINTIIKGNEFSILENKDKTSYCKYIIKLENTKTNEVGYMLPMRKY